MGDVVYWGKEEKVLGEYSAPKPVIHTIKNCDLKIDWGSQGIDILSGDVTEIIHSQPQIKSCVYGILFNGVNYGTPPCHSLDFSWDLSQELPINNGIKIINGSNLGRFEELRNSKNSFDAVWKGVAGVNTIIRELYQGGKYWGVVHGGSARAGGREPITYTSETFELDYSQQVRTVMTTTGESSSRQSQNNPQISKSGAIAITYDDSTTEEIPLSSCPEWVRIRKNDECPEGTCRIDCGDHYCCYGCGGTPVKEIPK